jgi:hypothetical protein
VRVGISRCGHALLIFLIMSQFLQLMLRECHDFPLHTAEASSFVFVEPAPGYGPVPLDLYNAGTIFYVRHDFEVA